MENEIRDKLIDFIEKHKYLATATDGWGYFHRDYVVDADDIIKEIKRVFKKKLKDS